MAEPDGEGERREVRDLVAPGGRRDVEAVYEVELHHAAVRDPCAAEIGGAVQRRLRAQRQRAERGKRGNEEDAAHGPLQVTVMVPVIPA